MRKWLAELMRKYADRMDPNGAPRAMSQMSFTFEKYKGIVVREDGKGCPLWYLGQANYERAFDEADTEWKTYDR